MDVADNGRVLLTSEEVRREISGIDPATGKERRGLGWFDGSALGDIRQTEKRSCLKNGEGPQGRFTWWSTGSWMDLRQHRWEKVEHRNFHRKERLQHHHCRPDHHKSRCIPSEREKAGAWLWEKLRT